jgi:type II secretory pathway pseudopilin PulG
VAAVNLELISLVIVGLLALVIVGGFIHDKARRIAREEHAASNARVLREFSRLTRRDPRAVVDLDGMDRRRWD